MLILAFTLLLITLSSYLNNMAIFCLPENCIFDNSNFTSAHIAQLVEHFHGKEEVACSIHAVGTKKLFFEINFFYKIRHNQKNKKTNYRQINFWRAYDAY